LLPLRIFSGIEGRGDVGPVTFLVFGSACAQ
jgi:hypothetical protein